MTLANKVDSLSILLQNKAAKIVLEEPKHLSATEALEQLGWDNMTRSTTCHRLILIFKALNGFVDRVFNFSTLKTFIITTRAVTRFLSLNNIAPGARTVLSTMPLMIGTFFQMELGTVPTFLLSKDTLRVFINSFIL